MHCSTRAFARYVMLKIPRQLFGTAFFRRCTYVKILFVFVCRSLMFSPVATFHACPGWLGLPYPGGVPSRAPGAEGERKRRRPAGCQGYRGGPGSGDGHHSQASTHQHIARVKFKRQNCISICVKLIFRDILDVSPAVAHIRCCFIIMCRHAFFDSSPY